MTAFKQVYFTMIFADAGNTFCKDADKKLANLTNLVENLDCGTSQGTTIVFCLL